MMDQPVTPKTGHKKSKRRGNGQGTINWDKRKQRYHAQIYDIHEQRRGLTFRTKKEAEEWIDSMKMDRTLGRSEYTISSKTTMDEFLDSWLMVRKPHLAPETFRSYSHLVRNHIKPAVGKIKVKEFDAIEVDSLMGKMKADGYGAGTIHATFAVLRAAFRHAIKKKKLTINPMDHADRPSGNSKPNKHIPKADFQKIYQVASLNPYMHARIEIGMIVGLRPGEIYGLKWSDVDFEAQVINVERQIQRVTGEGLVERTVKTGQSRTVPISIETVNILKTHKAYQSMNKQNWKNDYDLIFPNTIGNPLDRKRDSKWWNDVLKRADVPAYTLYQMRKSAFTYMAALVSVPSLLEYTGHTNVSTVMKHYAYATSEELNLGLSKMNELRPNPSFSYLGASLDETKG
jgi:integrase